MRIGKLEIAVFICGAAVMAVELFGSRLLAPYMGNSIYTWTSLIGVVLGALSLGYWAGGKLADRMAESAEFCHGEVPQNFASYCEAIWSHREAMRIAETGNPHREAMGKQGNDWAASRCDRKRETEVLGAIILGAAVSTAAIVPLSVVAQASFQILGAKYGPLFASMAIFSVPSFLFGMVSPYAIRIRAERMGAVGSTAGNMYAISTAGSISGTMLAGFVLIPAFGVKLLVLWTAAATLGAALLCFPGLKRAAAVSLLLILGASMFPAYPEIGGTVYAKDSEYYLIRVVDRGEDRLLLLDMYLNSGEKADSGEPLFDYTYCSLVALRAVPEPGNVLFLGLGGGTMPRYFLRNTDAGVDVIEIDPAVVRAAEEYFGLQESERMNVIAGDAREELKGLGKYDIIYIDAFNSYAVPYHLTTLEAAQEIKGHLGEGGAVVMNVISTPEGVGSGFFRAEYETYSSVFRDVYAFPVRGRGAGVQNIILLASDRELPLEIFEGVECAADYMEPEEGVLLTDDFAPVENLMAEVYAQR
ncbi:MAG: fused MFS/spermidine synthase [Candidatus Micrarchaeota archaeon]